MHHQAQPLLPAPNSYLASFFGFFFFLKESHYVAQASLFLSFLSTGITHVPVCPTTFIYLFKALEFELRASHLQAGALVLEPHLQSFMLSLF
jgi:hypothetical protein